MNLQGSQCQSKEIELLGSKMHYLEAGQGRPILLLHGVPTSSYIWRKIIPHLAPLGTCIAPDLIGFGQSGKPDITYSINDHIKFIDAFIEKLGLENITFVMHGWGSITGFNYAMQHEKNCRGLVFYEAFLRSLDGDEAALPLQELSANYVTEETTNDAVINGVEFVDTVIPQGVMRQLSDQDMQIYRQPFVEQGSGKPILQYLKEISHGMTDSEQADKIISAYTDKLVQSTLPKLLLYSIPGFISSVATTMWARDHLPNLEVIEIGEELHLGQESYPDVIGESISAWLQAVEQHSK